MKIYPNQFPHLISLFSVTWFNVRLLMSQVKIPIIYTWAYHFETQRAILPQTIQNVSRIYMTSSICAYSGEYLIISLLSIQKFMSPHAHGKLRTCWSLTRCDINSCLWCNFYKQKTTERVIVCETCWIQIWVQRITVKSVWLKRIWGKLETNFTYTRN